MSPPPPRRRQTPRTGPPGPGKSRRSDGPRQGPRPRTSPPSGLGGEQVEGRRAVRELLAAGRRRVRDVWISDSVAPSPLLNEIVELARDLGVPVRTVARTRLDTESRTDAPQGVLAHAEALPQVGLDELCRIGPGRPVPFLLAFDGITDPHNLGALLRTAACAGATGALLTQHRAAHVTPTVAKVAAGGIEHVALALVAGLPAALTRLKAAGIWTVGLDADGPTSVFDLELATEPVALVLGAEGAGLSRLTRERCDVVVSIPADLGPGSLNVAAAGAVACFEVVRRRKV